MQQKNPVNFTTIIIGGILIAIFFLTSCSREISVQMAANGGARCGQHLR